MTSRLTTPNQTVQKLQTSLQAKAKAEPAFRFHALWDKVCRADIIEEAYGRCRVNDGAPGADGITFERIETEGLDRWLERLRTGAQGRVLPSSAPVEGVDTEEQWRTPASRHSHHS